LYVFPLCPGVNSLIPSFLVQQLQYELLRLWLGQLEQLLCLLQLEQLLCLLCLKLLWLEQLLLLLLETLEKLVLQLLLLLLHFLQVLLHFLLLLIPCAILRRLRLHLLQVQLARDLQCDAFQTLLLLDGSADAVACGGAA
jgi:hypothetical protein